MNKRDIALPKEVKSIIASLEDKGFEAFAVGGCVRDALLGKEPKDWDITTNALPKEIKEIFPVTIDTGIAHGTVTVRMHRQSFEVTTYRTDGQYNDGRHPESVTFVRDLKEDLRRRDFTINALAYNEKSGIVDEFGGLSDLEAGIIRCVEDPRRRFSEDALRIMRAVRFVAQLGFELETETKGSCKELAPTLSRISVERICDELIKLICTDRPETVELLYELGISAVILPEWDAMMETEQNTRHHRGSVGQHTIYVMQGVNPVKKMRLAALLHDVGKPVCKSRDERGYDHFAGHPQMGAIIAEDIMRRLKLDNDTIHFVSKIVRYHDDRPTLNKKVVRRLMNRMGEEIFPEIFDFRKADILGQSEYRREDKLAENALFKSLYEEIIAENEGFRIKDLAISGKDVMDLGFEAGPEIGRVLNLLLETVIDDPSKNTPEILTSMVRDNFKRNI